MKFLNIIVASFLATSCCIFPACDNPSNFYEIKLIFKNNSNHDIEIIGESKDKSIKEFIKYRETKEEKEYNEFRNVHRHNEKELFSKHTMSFVGEISTIIKFNDNKCLEFINGQYIDGEFKNRDADNCVKKRSVYCYDNYVVTKVSDNKYLYTYTFTEEDYKNATPCEILEENDE